MMRGTPGILYIWFVFMSLSGKFARVVTPVAVLVFTYSVHVIAQESVNDQVNVNPQEFIKTTDKGISKEYVYSQVVSLPRQYTSIYSILNQISGQTGYYFVYESEILNSDRRVRLRAGNRTLSSWLAEIIDDPTLDFRIIENHILLYRPELDKPDNYISHANEGESDYFMVQGRIMDESTKNPLAYATVGIKGRAVGITSNFDGVFTLKLSNDYLDDQLSVSHIGYQSQVLPVQLFIDKKVDILMKTDYISIQEVMIRYFDPRLIVMSALERKDKNYSNEPVYHLNFYREGVMRSNRFINYSEAIFQAYKSSYSRQFDQDQVRLLQSRTISNVDRSDTLVLKIRAGIRSSLELDFVKNVPDFINPEYFHEYEFTKADIVSVDGNRAYAVAFEQKDHITEPLYKGILYIDMESLAFLGADFEVHPKHIDKAHNQFLTRRNRNLRASVERASYTVSYKYYNGRYHLNHVRADLHLSYRRRYQIFSKNYHVFVEMATSRIETEKVTRFSRREALRTDRVFMDGNHAYDPVFWRGYSIVAPEKHITDALSRIESQIESVVSEY
jgi:hypothetical protein